MFNRYLNHNKRMKRLAKTFSLLCCLILTALSLNAQNENTRAMDAMRRDYPKLMAMYGDQISGLKAHYIFVVDISSSMLPYESVVKRNILQFLDAVPDGDQISLIKMSDENHTGYIGLLKCTKLDNSVRASITEVVNGFHFNRTGSPEDGSDGFTMAKTVIDAINTVGSNDLTFVYMLTDFEYWTHRNRYNKNSEDWRSLEKLLPKDKVGGMCKYGIELSTGSTLNQNAIFKGELDRIFGKVEYQSVGSAALLSNWFSHVASGVMAVKLNTLLKKDWKEVDESVESKLTMAGNDLKFHLSAKDSPLVDGATVGLKTDNKYFVPAASEKGPFPGSVTVGRLELTRANKTFLPSEIRTGGNDYTAEITFGSPYAEEISRLQGVCGEVAGQGDAVSLTRMEEGTLPSLRAWNSILPLWLWILIAVIILVIIASFVYEYAFIKFDREWSLSVKASTPDGGSQKYNLDEVKAPFTFGPKESDLHVNGAPWAIKVYGKRHNPLTFQKSGYMLELEQGSFADVEIDGDEPKTISMGDKLFLCAAGHSSIVDVRIKEKGTTYKVSLN